MSQWDGKSRGAVVGYKIFIFFIQKFGIRSAYFILYFVAFYFLFFSVKGTKASFYYFHNRLGNSKLNSFFKVYKNYLVFGKTIIDKFAIASGLKDKFTYEFENENCLKKILDKKQGGILISAHIGNFEIAEYFFSRVDKFSTQINLVTTDSEHRAIKGYLESVSLKTNMKFIVIKDDMSHIFDMHNALKDKELICFTGDRYFKGSKTLTEKLLGKEAKFPAGAFLIGSRLKVPVVFIYIMKETNKHYHFSTEEAVFKNRDAQDLLKQYTNSIERILKKYPYQWFNYFDFWNDIK